MVKKAKGKRPKHISQRTCVGCRKIQAKRTLTRVVRTDQEALKGKLANALKIELTDVDRKILLDFMQKLPESVNEEEHDG